MTFYRYLIVLLLISIGFLSSSCALIFNGTKQEITVRSYEEDAKIYINGRMMGKENVRIKLKRKDNHKIDVRKEGCETYSKKVRSNIIPGWVVFDALLNWFAFLTDPTTGAWRELEPNVVTVELDCESDNDKDQNE